MLCLILVAAVVTVIVSKPTTKAVNLSKNLTAENLLKNAQEFLKHVDAQYAETFNKRQIANWNYASNLTEENLIEQLKVEAAALSILDQIIQTVNAFPYSDLEDEYIKKQFEKLSNDQRKFNTPIRQMMYIYNTAKICDYKNKNKCDLALEPEIIETFMRSRDPEELKHIWVEWRKASGEKIKPLFPLYVRGSNATARFYNFSDYAAYWMKDYETDDFPEQIENQWQQLKPLYLQLHAYVRRELRKKYGEDIVSKDGPIPAHLLGNVWAQTWSNIADFTAPFPGKELPDVSAALVEQGYNATSMFRLAEDFFTSINLTAMPDTFWEKSILTKQEGVEMICHSSAWDFYDGKDFRIKQCTRVNMQNLLMIYHEMGHIEYFLQYKDQPAVFRQGANPGFHEAVGEVISLSASTPSYLKKIGLLKNESIDREALLNHLYVKSLDKIAFLPFTYMMDRWRWNVFQGKVMPDNYNCNWWSLAEEYQGIEPPVDRSEEDFDPGAKFHIIADVEYIRYYVSSIIQFQFYKALCIKAKQYDSNNPDAKPLSQCDIYDNKDAGNLLKSMLEMGSSKPWPDAMEKISNQRQMDSAGLLEYFKPLTDWLTEENKKTNEYIGWKPTKKQCVQTRGELNFFKEVSKGKINICQFADINDEIRHNELSNRSIS